LRLLSTNPPPVPSPETVFFKKAFLMLTLLPEFREIEGERDLELWHPGGVLLLNGTSCTPQKQHGKVFFNFIQCHAPLALFVCV
jgi:hypothetical protein